MGRSGRSSETDAGPWAIRSTHTNPKPGEHRFTQLHAYTGRVPGDRVKRTRGLIVDVLVGALYRPLNATQCRTGILVKRSRCGSYSIQTVKDGRSLQGNASAYRSLADGDACIRVPSDAHSSRRARTTHRGQQAVPAPDTHLACWAKVLFCSLLSGGAGSTSHQAWSAA